MGLTEKERSRYVLQYVRPMEDTAERPVRDVDPDALAALTFQVWSFKQGQMVSMMIQMGDRLGLYTALDGAGRVSADELAARTGLHRRWLLEWLRGQAAARLLEHHGDDVRRRTPAGLRRSVGERVPFRHRVDV